MPRSAGSDFIITFLRVYFGSAQEGELYNKWLACAKQDLVQDIISQGIAGFFYQVLQTGEDLGLPDELRQGLKPAARSIALQNTLYEREGRQLTAALEQQNIAYIILKGFSLMERLYEHTGIRPVSDLDIYVSQADYLRVKETLLTSGYQATMTADFRGSLQEYQAIAEVYCTEMQFSKNIGKFKINLDVHWGIDGLWEGSPLRALFPVEEYPWMDYARRVKAGDWSFSTLSREMQFLHMSSHFALHHQYQGVKWFLDLCLFVQKLGSELDWDFIHRTAATADSRKIIGVILCMIADEIGLQAPAVPSWKYFWSGKALPGEYSFYCKRLFSGGTKKGQYLAYIMLPLQRRNKARVAGYYLFNPRAVPHWRIREYNPAWCWWQPFYLLYRAGKEIWSKSRP